MLGRHGQMHGWLHRSWAFELVVAQADPGRKEMDKISRLNSTGVIQFLPRTDGGQGKSSGLKSFFSYV